MKNTRLFGYADDCNVAYDTIAVDNILDLHKYLIKKHNKK